MAETYSKPEEHYTVCSIKVYKGIPCNMVALYKLALKNHGEIFEKY